MPRTLKRRSDAISGAAQPEIDDESPQASQSRTQTAQRKRQRSIPLDNDHSDNNASDGSLSETEDRGNTQNQQQVLIKKLVRLALSTEFARQPLRRTEIQARILKETPGTGRVNFKQIFNGAQQILREVFGMELVDLPQRSTPGVGGSINDRRKAASQAAETQTRNVQRIRRGAGHNDTQSQTQNSRQRDPVARAQSWTLVSTLPAAYRYCAGLLPPNRAPTHDEEATYTALYSLIISLIYLNSSPPESTSNSNAPAVEDITPLSDSKLVRYLSRMNIDTWTPMNAIAGGSSLEKLLSRMVREGYLEKKRDTSSGEEIVEWTVGPRGRREIGREGVAGLVASVYGHGVVKLGSERRGDGNDAERGDGQEGERNDETAGVVKMEKEELERRLKRTLGDINIDRLQLNASMNPDETNGDGAEHGARPEVESDVPQQPSRVQQRPNSETNQRRSRSRRPRQEEHDDGDDDEEEDG